MTLKPGSRFPDRDPEPTTPTLAGITLGDIEIVWVDYVGSDWVGIYLKGDKIYEGHPPDFDDVLRLLAGVSQFEDAIPTATMDSGDLTDKRRMRGMPGRRPVAS